MPDPCEILCEACGEKHATHHIANMIGGEEAITRNLCAQCFQIDPSLAATSHLPNLTELIRTGKCSYCGDPPVTGSLSSGVGGPDKVHLLCEQCRKDFDEFVSRPENQWEIPEIDPSLNNDEFSAELSHIADLCRQSEAHRKEFMRMKVAQRKSGAN